MADDFFRSRHEIAKSVTVRRVPAAEFPPLPRAASWGTAATVPLVGAPTAAPFSVPERTPDHAAIAGHITRLIAHLHTPPPMPEPTNVMRGLLAPDLREAIARQRQGADLFRQAAQRDAEGIATGRIELRADNRVPPDQVHLFDRAGRRTGAITNLDNDTLSAPWPTGVWAGDPREEAPWPYRPRRGGGFMQMDEQAFKPKEPPMRTIAFKCRGCGATGVVDVPEPIFNDVGVKVVVDMTQQATADGCLKCMDAVHGLGYSIGVTYPYPADWLEPRR
jgi:hypothetical protein